MGLDKHMTGLIFRRRRGPAAEAQLLYTELAPPQPVAREAWTRLLGEEESAVSESVE